MKIADYFDLSVRLLGRTKAPPAAAPMQGGTAAMPVQGGAAAAPALAKEPQTNLGVGHQIGIYAVLLSAIVSSRYLDLYRAGVGDQLAVDWKYILSVGIVSLLAFPAVYDRARMSTGQPVLVQIGLIFTTGMGWEKIVATVVGK